jgi:hypothetical protein
MTINMRWLGYAAGLFDGEGTVGAYPNHYIKNGKKVFKSYVYRLRIAMTDEDALDSFHWAIGLGKIYGPWRNGPSPIPIYCLDIKGFEEVQAVCAMLWPWLSQRRKDQIKQALLMGCD